MSQPKIVLRALPNVEFVHGYPGIPANPERPQATIRGSLELRLGQQAVKAKWVKVELRRIETIPGHGNRNEEFTEIIGNAPLTLWQSQGENELLTSRDLAFTILIPETVPSSVALKNGHGIKYEVAANLCMKGKKGIFRREASMIISHSVSVVIDKHELHSTWPVYAQPESCQSVRDDGLVLIVDRGNTCFGPGDRIVIIATLKTDNLTPIVVRGFEFHLVEIISFIAGHQPHGKHKGGNVMSTVTVIGEHKIPLSLTLYGGTQHKTELGCIVPPSHTTSTINTARHVDVSYKMKVKVNLDFIAPVEMELPVTMTNWPRNVSAEIVRRIGAIPNLSPNIIPATRPVPAISSHSYGPPLPPPTGALPNIPDMPPAVPPKFEPLSVSRAVQPGTVVTPLMAPSNLPPPSSVGHPDVSQMLSEPPKAAAELSVSSHESGPSATSNHDGGVDDFGYITANGNPSKAETAPARIIRVPTQRANMADSESSGESETRVFSSSGSMSGRRNRAMSRLKVMNANEDIPEEPSPIRPDGPSVSQGSGSQTKVNGGGRSRGGSLSNSSRNWMSAEEEKKRLYESAKAQVDKAHGRARSQDRIADSENNNIQYSAASTISATSQKSRGKEASSPPKSGWLTAEEEKRRLFEQAQAKVRQTQGLGPMSPISPTSSEPNGAYGSHTAIGTRPGIPRPNTSDSQSTESLHVSPHKPAMSAGAALYSHAMASIARSGSATAARPQLSSQPRRNISAAASNASSQAQQRDSSPKPNGHGTNAAPSSNEQRPVQPTNVSVPQEAPISYEELFGNRTRAASPINEKERLRQKYEAEDAAAMRAAAPAPSPQRAPSVRTRTQPKPPQQPLSEKEVMRRAFEARDAALRAAGQTPPPMILPSSSSSAPVQSSLQRSTSVSSLTPPSFSNTDTGPQSSNRPLTAAEEKAQLAAQYAISEPSYFSVLPTNLSAASSPDVHKSNLTRERSHKSDTSEVFLRRDPSISAGKKRASQMQAITPPPPPPPLPPRPPQEYIEETKEVDRRTTLLNSLPLDFSSSFDVGFGQMVESPTTPNMRV